MEDQFALQPVLEQPPEQLLEEDPIPPAVHSPLHQEEVEHLGKDRRSITILDSII